jgi:hypothetical protein
MNRSMGDVVARSHLRWLGAGALAGLLVAALITLVGVARPGPLPAAAAGEAPAPPAVAFAEAQPIGVDLLPWVAEAPRATLLAAAEPAESPNEASDAPLATISRGRLAYVPFRTQRDGSPYAGSNCGPAALAMVLESYGISQGNDDLRYLTHSYQGTWPRRGGTALEHMAQVGIDLGLQAGGLWEGGGFRRWSIADVRAEVEQGHPVIALVKYRLLPGRDYSPVRYDHYIVLWDVTPDGFIYNDPIYEGGDEGYSRFMTNAQLDAAMAPTMEPRQAVAFY